MPDTGAPWNIPYVAGTDLVRDWPTDSQDLAEAIADALDNAATDTIVRTGTDTTEIRVGDDGAIAVADSTTPTPVARPLAFATASGTATTSASADITVTLPSGRFTSTPVIVATVQNDINFYAACASVSTSSFTASAVSNAGARAAKTLGWLAIQLAP